MAVEFIVDVQRVSKSKLILDAIMGLDNLTDKADAIASLFTIGPNKTLEKIRKATAPNKVRFYNPDPVTKVCRGLNGSVWALGSSAIRTPPLHWNCKSVLIYER